jgi:antitoxin component of MazEF toxin-antitoxin module
MTSKNDGIDWSAPVKVQAGEGNALIVEIPARVVGQFKIESGDILSFSCFADGSIEVWPIKKGTYSSLEDEDTKSRIAKEKSK